MREVVLQEEKIVDVIVHLVAVMSAKTVVSRLREENDEREAEQDHQGKPMTFVLFFNRRRHDSNTPPRKEIKEEPLSDRESPVRRTAGSDRRRSDSYSSDDGHNHGKMRSMVSKK